MKLLLDVLPVESVDCTVTVVVPIFVGVPVIVLVLLSYDKPEGKPLTVFVNVPVPLSVIVTLIGGTDFPTSIVWLLTLIVGV